MDAGFPDDPTAALDPRWDEGDDVGPPPSPPPATSREGGPPRRPSPPSVVGAHGAFVAGGASWMWSRRYG